MIMPGMTSPTRIRRKRRRRVSSSSLRPREVMWASIVHQESHALRHGLDTGSTLSETLRYLRRRMTTWGPKTATGNVFKNSDRLGVEI